uniref:Uncharacterized protein n=1 Tax=Anopheles culicifacies TaxID=139723 RepID=A0A182MIG9_9DIPT
MDCYLTAGGNRVLYTATNVPFPNRFTTSGHCPGASGSPGFADSLSRMVPPGRESASMHKEDEMSGPGVSEPNTSAERAKRRCWTVAGTERTTWHARLIRVALLPHPKRPPESE